MRWYTVTEAAGRLGRNRVLVYRWLEERRIGGKKFGHAWLVSERDLRRFMANEPERRKRRSR